MKPEYTISMGHGQGQTPSPGATVEVCKKPKGRPKGSKNKAKSLYLENHNYMSPFVLQVPHGYDVVEAITRFARRNKTGLCVLTASGSVLNAALHSTTAVPVPDVTCSDQYLILSISAAFLPHQSLTSPSAPKPLTVSLAAPNGHVVGGLVSGRLVAVGTVSVIATSFNNPVHHIITNEEVESVGNTLAGGEEIVHEPPPPPPQSLPLPLPLPPPAGWPIFYNSHQVSSNGLWAQIRQPSQPQSTAF